MDLSRTIIAKSDQLNADDLIGGPQTFTVVEVRQGDAEQPVSIVLAEWPPNRPFKPSKTVTRILVHAWGMDSDDWPKGARMTLFRDAEVKWAGQAIGGIRVSHLSHIKGKLKVALQESKGKKVLYTVDPLPDAPKVAKPATANPATLAQLTAAFVAKGVPEDKWLAGVHHFANSAAPTLEDVTEAEARTMLAELANRPDVEPTSPDAA